MKKLFSIICALCIMHCALAQTKCETIAEIKALESGTECVYEGYAITIIIGSYSITFINTFSNTLQSFNFSNRFTLCLC